MYERVNDSGQLPSDSDVIAFLRQRPGIRFKAICERFAVPYCYSVKQPGPRGQRSGYTIEADKLSQQMQRMRLAGELYTVGQCWHAKN